MNTQTAVTKAVADAVDGAVHGAVGGAVRWPVRGAVYEAVTGAVGEAVTNIATARIASLERVKRSANWMAAAGYPGEDAALYDAVREVYSQSKPPFRARPFDVQIIGGVVSIRGAQPLQQDLAVVRNVITIRIL